MNFLSKEYWQNRWEENNTGWDIGSISKPLKDYIDHLEDKNLTILIPGAGNAYELDYLLEQGFKNTFVIEIAEKPLNNIVERNSSFKKHLIHDDFFNHEMKYDLIIEQTFFCALNPNLRQDYANKMYDLLNDNGRITGLLFDFPLTEEGPPFGGSKEEYLNLFSEKFKIKTLEKAYNSIKPRANRELFFTFEKK